MMAQMPSLRQKRFVMGISRGLSKTDAVLQAGYNPKNRRNAGIIAYHAYNSKGVQKLLIKRGLDDESISQAMIDALKATKIENFNKEDILTADHYIRLKVVELWLKVQGIIGSPINSESRVNTPPNIKIQFVKIANNEKPKVIKTI